jgi:hypothetical protein
MRVFAQDLSPRAYLITPLRSNAITLTWSFYDGGINLNGSIPVTGATGTYHVPSAAHYRAIGLFGHSANVTVVLLYGIGTLQGHLWDAAIGLPLGTSGSCGALLDEPDWRARDARR